MLREKRTEKIAVRADKPTVELLKELCEKLKYTQADVVELSIRYLYDYQKNEGKI